MITKNSEILFLYDAQNCNPNGDMDNENRPRMDYDTYTNLVSDVRLKRYIRDYFELVKEQQIFITSKAKDAKERNKQLQSEKLNHLSLIDVRLFGAVTAEDDKVGGHITGPVQFNWGYSLHPVELIDSNTITSSFSGGSGIGKDFRVHYSMLAFSGSVNANTAKYSEMTAADLEAFDEAILHGIPLARTRSKIGQYPRLYLRVEMKDNSSFLKDLRSLIKMGSENPSIAENLRLIRDVKDYYLDFEALASYLEQNDQNISQLLIWKDDQLMVRNFEKIANHGKFKALQM